VRGGVSLLLVAAAVGVGVAMVAVALILVGLLLDRRARREGSDRDDGPAV
jgi:hypothetical protein